MGSSNGTVHHLPRAQKLVLFGFSFLEFSKSKFSKKADEDWTTITISALPLINLLELLTVNNVYRLHALRFTHLWHKNFLPNVFYNFFKYAGSLHTYNTRYAASQNLYKTRVRTNTGKQTISFMASIFWHNIPPYMKNLNVYQFSKQIKLYLFSEQLENSWNT